LRALAARHPELAGEYRLPPALRAAFVEREVRLGGGRRVRALVRRPPLTMLVHAPGDESAAALREELRVRGDRYVLVAESGAVPHPAALDALIEALESAPYVAAAAPDAASLNGRCVLLAAGRFPQHVEPRGATLREALGALLQDVELLRRAVRAPGRSASLPRPPRVRTASAVFVVAAAPEVTRIALDAALAASGSDDELIGVCAASAETARRMLGAYPSLRVEADGADPLLTGALNRALGAARGELIFVVADDVLLPPATLRRLRDAFDRIPCLGAAFPCVPGAPLGEGVLDVAYADLKEMRALAERRENERAREAEPLDAAGTPAFAIAREALYAVGGIDPAYGPTRRGIADLVVRLRRAGYAVVRCDDTLAHRFDASASRSALALADAHDPVPVMPAPEILARGLSHAERVPFTSPAEARTSGTAAHDTAALCVVALPVGDARELERASAIVASAARAFDAAAPVRVHVLLDGAISPAEAAAALRRVLAASGRALETTVTVRVERSADIAAWRAALGGASRIVVGGGLRRAALSDCREIPVDEIPVLLQTAAP
jgi:GT2 family glycosyltransferase